MLVVIESPYKYNPETGYSVAAHREYLDEAIKWCLDHGHSPYASHRMLTRVLDDLNPQQRVQGIRAGLNFHRVVDKVIFFVDLGRSPGMLKALAHCKQNNFNHGFETIR